MASPAKKNKYQVITDASLHRFLFIIEADSEQEAREICQSWYPEDTVVSVEQVDERGTGVILVAAKHVTEEQWRVDIDSPVYF